MNNPEVTNQMIKNCLERTGYEYDIGSPEVRRKSEQTHFERTGFYNPAQCKDIQQKMSNSYYDKTGFYHNFANPQVIKQIREDRFEKTGYSFVMEDPKNIQTMKNTNIIKYGVENVFQSDIIKAEIIKTNNIRYSCDNVMQNAEIAQRCMDNAKKVKKLILPSGNELNFQGYENIAIIKLLESYNEDEIISLRTGMPSIQYSHNGTLHRYYPDIYIEKENLIIEVKSAYTFTLDPEKIELKKQACLDAGFNYQFWICSNKEVIEIV
jgi:hypothetical protein